MTFLARLLLIAAFATALAVPGAGTLLRVAAGGESARSALEMRRLSTFEQIGRLIVSGRIDWTALPDALDRAFADQLFGRVAITRHLNAALVYGFGHSTAEELDIGPEGHWFRTGAPLYDLLSCAAPTGIDHAASDRFIDAYSSLAVRLRAEGIESFLLIIPNKAAVYPQALPARLARYCTERPYHAEQVAERLRAAGAPAAFDLDWFQARDPALLWHHRNYHWSIAGARSFLHDQFRSGLLSDLGIGPSPINWLDRPRSEIVDLSNRMGVPQDRYEYPLPGLPERIGRPTDAETERARIGDYSRHFNPAALDRVRLFTSDRTSGRGLLIGDSFAKRLDDYAARHFAETMTVETGAMSTTLERGRFEALIRQYRPDYVIFVFEQAKFEPVTGSQRGRTWISAFERAR